MNMIKNIGLLTALILSLIPFSLSLWGAERPNIIIINADDLGYGDLSCYGAEKLKTPNIDRLAKQGRRYTDAHSASAVCSPSRYGLLTGQYPIRKNFFGPVSLQHGLSIDTDQITIASLLKEAGYETAIIGKWHLGFGEETPNWNDELKPGPLEVGFDYYYGIPSVNSGPPFVYVENHRVIGLDPDDPLIYDMESTTKQMPEKSGYKRIGGAVEAHALYVDELVGTTLKDKAVKWINARSDHAPFFLYLALTNVHHPFTPAEQFVGTSECGPYGDFAHEMDWIVGEVMGALEKKGIADNTLVIFTSDNGGMFNVTAQEAWKAGHHLNGELLGFKFGAWEGGHRIPFIVRWPAEIPAGTVSDHLISHVDILATLASIVDRPLSKKENLDSVDQLQSFTGKQKDALRDTLVISPNNPGHLLIRHKNWVYIAGQGEGGFIGTEAGKHGFAGPAAVAFAGMLNSDIVDGVVRKDAPPAQLYDLDADLQQSENLYEKKPEVVRTMEGILQDYRGQIPDVEVLGFVAMDKLKQAAERKKKRKK